MERPTWAGTEIDLQRPSAARVYDVHLGGSHNFQADRDVARRITDAMPELPAILRANRNFLRRAVRHLVADGVTQFLDLGSGIPTAGTVHEVAWRADPACRVVYVDTDAVAVAHSRALVAGADRAAAVHADLRRPDDVLNAPETVRLLDFTRPVAVLMVAVLPFVPDEDDPAGLIRRYLGPAAPGSRLVVSHATQEGSEEHYAEATDHFRRCVGEFAVRTRAEVAGLFGDLTLVDPGVVYLTEWRPDPGEEDADPRRTSTFAAVGRKG
ncbi:SAM-dependent methyltransferase [Actinosynnema sp. NPDC023587]|uniref:SAM-dependent methyltransferase n=1 Tax=Actinosynnema sp. NPDC023587 TaxID=3154695 RepID=UPI0034077FE0